MQKYYVMNLVAGTLLFLFSNTVFSATEGRVTGSADAGFYGVASGGVNNVAGGVANGWKLGLGYDWGKYFSTEIAYHDLINEHDRTNGSCAIGSTCFETTIKVNGYNIAAIGRIPFSDSFVGLIGVTYGNYSIHKERLFSGSVTYSNISDSSASAPLVLVGLQVSLDSRSSLRLTYETGKIEFYDPTADQTKAKTASMAQLGMVVKF